MTEQTLKIRTDPAPTWRDIEGWLQEPTADFTQYILRGAFEDPERNAMEIGVYMGKYLSVIAAELRGRIAGYDLFAHQPGQRGAVEAAFEEMYPDAAQRLRFIQTDSRDLTPERVRADLGDADCAFVSIDGSHQVEDVIADSLLADAVLSPDGIVAYDDFANPAYIGVNEAFYRLYFGVDGQRMNLVPFAYVCNKLFLCRPERQQDYLTAAEGFLKQLSGSKWALKLRAQQLRGAMPISRLCGHDILCIVV